MINPQSTKTNLSSKGIVPTALSTATSSEEAESTEQIEYLQVIQYQFIRSLNSQSIETMTRIILAPGETEYSIHQSLDIPCFKNGQGRLESWDNKGGRMQDVSG